MGIIYILVFIIELLEDISYCLLLYMYILLDYNRIIDDNKLVYIIGLLVDKCSKIN